MPNLLFFTETIYRLLHIINNITNCWVAGDHLAQILSYNMFHKQLEYHVPLACYLHYKSKIIPT